MQQCFSRCLGSPPHGLQISLNTYMGRVQDVISYRGGGHAEGVSLLQTYMVTPRKVNPLLEIYSGVRKLGSGFCTEPFIV